MTDNGWSRLTELKLESVNLITLQFLRDSRQFACAYDCLGIRHYRLRRSNQTLVVKFPRRSIPSARNSESNYYFSKGGT